MNEKTFNLSNLKNAIFITNDSTNVSINKKVIIHLKMYKICYALDVITQKRSIYDAFFFFFSFLNLNNENSPLIVPAFQLKKKKKNKLS